MPCGRGNAEAAPVSSPAACPSFLNPVDNCLVWLRDFAQLAHIFRRGCCLFVALGVVSATAKVEGGWALSTTGIHFEFLEFVWKVNGESVVL